MSEIHKGYLLGIGSNIHPGDNIAQIIILLLERFLTLHVSRILRIPPVGINSDHDFLNTVIFIETNITENNLKNICNDIEIKLGRNHSDPMKKTNNRTADLDILSMLTFPDDKVLPAFSITDEYFLYPLIDELLAFLYHAEYQIQQSGISVNIDALTFGQTATTIYCNTRTGNKRISQQAFYCQIY